MDNYSKRDIFDEVAAHLGKKEITVIIGPRRAGKTVLLEQLRDYLKESKQAEPGFIYYFNLDILKDRQIFQNQTDFIEFIKSRAGKEKIYVFIDEAQKIPEAGIFFKGVYDSELPVKLVLTGSSNLEIRSKIHESLAGRKRVFNLLPFSFGEIVRLKNPVVFNLIDKSEKLIEYDKKELENIFLEYCLFGGYPQVVLENKVNDKKAMLEEIFTSYVEKDIIGFLKVENESNFTKLVRLLAGQIGNLITFSELASLVGTDRYTIERYVSNLEKTFVIQILKPFYTNSRQEVVKSPKVYFIDNGIRNLALDRLDKKIEEREDKGALIENAILKELLILSRQYYFQLRFWRSKQKAEVDFILEKGKEIVPIEIKSNLASDKLESSFSGFIKRYGPKNGLAVNLKFQGQRNVGGTQVLFIQPYELKDAVLKILGDK